MHHPEKPGISRRRWVQYSLRTFIVATVAITVLVAVTANKYRRRKAAIDDIQLAGGTMGSRIAGAKWLRTLVDEEYLLEPIRVSLGGITNRVPNPKAKGIRELLMQMKQFSGVTALDLRRSDIRDSDLAVLKGFRSLEVLRLSDTKVTDKGLNRCIR